MLNKRYIQILKTIYKHNCLNIFLLAKIFFNSSIKRCHKVIYSNLYQHDYLNRLKIQKEYFYYLSPKGLKLLGIRKRTKIYFNIHDYLRNQISASFISACQNKDIEIHYKFLSNQKALRCLQ